MSCQLSLPFLVTFLGSLANSIARYAPWQQLAGCIRRAMRQLHALYERNASEMRAKYERNTSDVDGWSPSTSQPPEPRAEGCEPVSRMHHTNLSRTEFVAIL